jgi:hypothetical protein
LSCWCQGGFSEQGVAQNISDHIGFDHECFGSNNLGDCYAALEESFQDQCDACGGDGTFNLGQVAWSFECIVNEKIKDGPCDGFGDCVCGGATNRCTDEDNSTPANLVNPVNFNPLP